jgi:glycosyltransferase involved in cell wall biosynthesis
MKVTIGIPVYNCERWVRTAIQSALDQTWSAKELIVVDDGSTDATPEICASFGDRIKFVQQNHRGGNAARNHILELAAGEWIQFLDADDYLKPLKLETQLQSAPAGADIICSPVVWEYWDNDLVLSEGVQDLQGGSDWYALWLAWNMPQTGGCLWRKGSLAAIGGWNESLPFNQEYELYFRGLRAGLNYRFVDAPLAVYRLWSENTVCRRDKTAVIHGITELIDQFLGWLRSSGQLTPKYEHLAARACFGMARTLASRDIRSAAAYYRQRKKGGLICAAGPGAPWNYRLALKCFGFTTAEGLAKFSRKLPRSVKHRLKSAQQT